MAERIKTAREWGDLKENSEYHDAKNDQAHLETKILRIREQLLHAEVREVETQTDVVGFGSRVEVEDAGSGKQTVYTLVSAPEAARRRGQAVGRLAGRQGAGRRAGGRHREARDAARRARAEDPRYRRLKRRRLSASTSVASSAGKCPP